VSRKKCLSTERLAALALRQVKAMSADEKAKLRARLDREFVAPKIGPTTEIKHLISTNTMPSIDELLKVIEGTRLIYEPKIRAARKKPN